MSATGLDVFDTTLQKTNTWLKDLMQVLGWQDRQRAYQALRATLHALRDRLTVEEGAQLAAQLPMLIRGIFYEGWDPSSTPQKVRHQKDFLNRIAVELRGVEGINPEEVARAVFLVISDRITMGEIEDILDILPPELHEFWP